MGRVRRKVRRQEGLGRALEPRRGGQLQKGRPHHAEEPHQGGGEEGQALFLLQRHRRENRQERAQKGFQGDRAEPEMGHGRHRILLPVWESVFIANKGHVRFLNRRMGPFPSPGFLPDDEDARQGLQGQPKRRGPHPSFRPGVAIPDAAIPAIA